jgi:hypothetical protein
MADDLAPFPYPLGGLPTPREKLAKAWPIELLLAPPTAIDPEPTFHSPMCPSYTIDQFPLGSCVSASGSYVQDGQEVLDEGRVVPKGAIDYQATYKRVKTENGDPNDTSPGLWPPQLWDSVKARGWVTTDGVARTITGYYGLPTPTKSDAFIALLQATIRQLGPTQLDSGWDANWGLTDAAGCLKAPIGTLVGGHAYSACGWRTLNGVLRFTFHQTWGAAWGHHPIAGHFDMDPAFWDRSYMWAEGWHVTDKLDAPTPGGPDVLPAIDKVARLLSVPVGTQFYAPDTNAPLVKLGGTKPARVYSPHKVSTTQYAAVISTGGVQQTVRVNAADVTVIATSPLT